MPEPYAAAELEAACKAVHELEDMTVDRYLSVKQEVAAAFRAVLPDHDARVREAERARVAEEMRRWRAGGGRIIGVSNQGGIALGYVTMERVTAAMTETHRQTGGLFDKIAWCRHHPDAKHPEFARCWCRKPSPGLLIEASLAVSRLRNEFYPPYMGLMVGDRPEDEECARLAGLDFTPAAEWRALAEVSDA